MRDRIGVSEVSASRPRVAVMGGSLGGLNAALWLREAGCDVEVCERSGLPLSGLGAGIVLNPATVRYFTEHGSLDLDEIGVRSHWLRYMALDGATAHEQRADHLFSSYNSLYRSFLESFGEGHYHLGSAVEGFEQNKDGVSVRLSDGREERFDLLVCADGVRSSARSFLLPGVSLKYAGYIAWRGTVEEGGIGADIYDALSAAITYHVMPDSHFLAYPIPMVDGVDSRAASERPYINWLWYRNVAEGANLDDLMTDKNGERREVSMPPGSVQNRHIEKLREDAMSILPPPLVEVVLRTGEPFIQTVLDAEVARMAFGRVALIGDAAFALRPHAAVGSAKAAEDGFRLGKEVRASNGDVVAALENWEPGQMALGKTTLARTREAGNRSQFENSWEIGSPLPFGLYEVGDSEMP